MKKIIILLALITPIIFSILVYRQLPDILITHWGIDGTANGYSQKLIGVSLLPIISIVFFLVAQIIPKVDPNKINIAKFRSAFDSFVGALLWFLAYVHVLSLTWNLGYNFDFVQLLTPAFSALFLVTSNVLTKVKQNWFIGIRTPWTMSSEIVWNKTHALGAKLFKVVAFVTLIGVIFPKLSFYFLMIPVISVAIYTVGYSYFLYSKLKK